MSDRVVVTLSLSRHELAALRVMTADFEASATDVVRRALASYRFMHDAQCHGATLLVADAQRRRWQLNLP